MESLSVIEKISLLLAAMLMFSLGLHIGSDYKVKKAANVIWIISLIATWICIIFRMVS